MYMSGRVDEESDRRCQLEMQVASLHTEKANFEVVRDLQDEYRKLVLVIDGVQVRRTILRNETTRMTHAP
jgi:hypothetical protein